MQWDTYLACVEWSAILGGPLRFQKTADPELDTDSVISLLFTKTFNTFTNTEIV